MFGLGFVFLCVIYVLGIRFISKIFPIKSRKYFIAAAILIPITYPKWYLIYPSYQEFQRLCDAPGRYEILKTQETDYVYSDSGCYLGFKIAKDKDFKGYECEHWVSVGQESYPRQKKLYRFSRGELWNSPVCQNECVKKDSHASWEETCQAKCFNGTEISAPTFKYESSYSDVAIIPDKLMETRRAKVSEKREAMAVLKDYTYYPYGTGWATILGGASGSPPSMQCQKKYDLYRYDFLKPVLKQ